MIDTLLFDLDNTLLDFDKAEANAITRALGDVGISVTDEMRDCYHKINLAQWKLLEQGKMTREEVKELLPIMQAYSEGKTIEFKDKRFKVDGAFTVGMSTSELFKKYPKLYYRKQEGYYYIINYDEALVYYVQNDTISAIEYVHHF